jgi:putative SOS response-associated peptidase YedK
MCNLYRMTQGVDEIRRLIRPFDGDRDNLPPFDNIFPGYRAPVLRRNGDGFLKLEMMNWGFPGPAAARPSGDQCPQPQQPVLAIGA